VKQLARIVVGVDFSKPARNAFEQALAISARREAELVVVHAVPPHQPFSRYARARIVLMERLRQKAVQAGVAFSERVQTGAPAEIILLHARSLQPDLIVVGTHQRSGLARLRVGSVGERVATQATVPVLIVPRGHNRATAAPFRHVAVAVDFGPASDRAIEQALAMATDAGDRITLLHAVPGFSAEVPLELFPYGAGEFQTDLVSDARRRLQLAVPLHRNSPATIHTRVITGNVTTGIRQAVDDIGADVLVVGVPNRGAVPRMLFGTTAARLLKVIGVPMLTVPEGSSAKTRGEDGSLPLAS
jgi:nucleotide-binding universal stress UspA family protein